MTKNMKHFNVSRKREALKGFCQILFSILFLLLTLPCFAHYTASPPSTTEGGGTWGSILWMGASIETPNSSKVIFTLKKQDGAFEENNTLYLREEHYGPGGTLIGQGSVNSGVWEWTYDLPLSPSVNGKSYYIYAENVKGNAWVGPIKITYSNNPPNDPVVINEPTSGNTGESLTYSYKISDPDNDNVKVYISWGDGTGTWKGDFVSSGSQVSGSHTYSTAGTYDVYITVFDVHGSGSSVRHAVVTIKNEPKSSYVLTVKSSPGEASIKVSPNDINGQGNGITEFTREYKNGTEVTLTAPIEHKDKLFSRWIIDDTKIDLSITIKIKMDKDLTVRAVYKGYCILTVLSSPAKAHISVNPKDVNGEGDGITVFKREYDIGTKVTLTAPGAHNDKTFSKWTIDGANDNINQTLQVTMNKDLVVKAVYKSNDDNIDCVNIGKLTLCADSISQSGNVYTLSGNVHINDKLRFSADVIYTRETDSGGTLLSAGYPYVRLASGDCPIFTITDKIYHVDGTAGTLSPAFQDVYSYALELSGIPLWVTSTPITIKNDGVQVGGVIGVGSYGFRLCTVYVTMLLKPGDREYLTYAQISSTASDIPGLKATAITLTYDSITDELTGEIELEFPFLGMKDIKAAIQVQPGCIDGFLISVALQRVIPLGTTGLKITGLTLKVDNICNMPQFYIFFGGDLGIAEIPSKIFALENAGLGYQHPYHLELQGGTAKLLNYPVASLSGWLDASGDKYKTGFGLSGTVDFGGIYVAQVDLSVLIKLLKFTGSAKGTLYIPDFECDNWKCDVIKWFIEIFIDLPYEVTQQWLDVEISRETGEWSGHLKGMVSVFDLSLAASLEYSGGKLHLYVGENFDDMIHILRKGKTRVLANSIEQSITFTEDREDVLFAVTGNSILPEIYLKSPRGEIITADNTVDFAGVHYLRNSKRLLTLVLIRKAVAGTWTVGVRDLSQDDVQIRILARRPLSETSFKTVEQKGNTVDITSSVEQARSDTRVSFFFSRRASGNTGVPMAEKLPVSNGTVSTQWDTSTVTTGTYYIFSKTYDDVNPPVINYYHSPIKVNHHIIEPPTDLQGIASGSAVTLTWKPSESSTVSGYNVLYTDEPAIGGYKYRKAVNNKDSTVIEGLDPTKDYCFAVVAFDDLGNFSIESYPYYTTRGGTPKIDLSRTSLTFGAVLNKDATSSQRIFISNIGSGTLNWTAVASESWLQMAPTNGAGDGIIDIDVKPVGLSAGNYTGTITVNDSNASNSPRTIQVNLKLKAIGGKPFGVFSNPKDGVKVYGVVPVSGWALDDIQVAHVQIYRGDKNARVYIGDAMFVEGARPDVEQAYPHFPMNYRCGWGYMLLSNTLPNNGNGTFKLYAIATDIEGNQVELGTTTIICDNANAVKPFGTIDTPGMGEIASGRNYENIGWVLTPMPNKIPEDGSTIQVFVDGVKLGNTKYNIFRSDIADLFPGYANSSGSGSSFKLDTTPYRNGVHTIEWVAEDDAGNKDGIGSRYFTVLNTGGSNAAQVSTYQEHHRLLDIVDIPLDYQAPPGVIKGYKQDMEPQMTVPGKNRKFQVEISELERIEIHLNPLRTGIQNEVSGFDDHYYVGYLVVGEQLRPLPVGSTMDMQRGVFYWQPGVGFSGLYRFVFIERRGKEEMAKKFLNIKISPKFPVTGK